MTAKLTAKSSKYAKFILNFIREMTKNGPQTKTAHSPGPKQPAQISTRCRAIAGSTARCGCKFQSLQRHCTVFTV